MLLCRIVNCRRNLFKVPSWKSGKSFVGALLFCAFGEDSAMDCAALKAAIVLPALLLQKPHAMSKAKDHSIHLECRIKLWENGYIIWKGKRHLGAPKGTRTFIESYVQKTVSKIMGMMGLLPPLQ